MKAFICELCGYRYSPKNGDPENGIEEGTLFSELPEDWTCPECGANKEDFEEDLETTDDGEEEEEETNEEAY